MLRDEIQFFDASRVFYNGKNDIIEEINQKGKVTVSKLVFSKGMWNKFSIVARSYRKAVSEIQHLQMSQSSTIDNRMRQPVF